MRHQRETLSVGISGDLDLRRHGHVEDFESAALELGVIQGTMASVGSAGVTVMGSAGR